METQRLVLPEHLNQYGHLFGGQLLAWVDEAAWIAATLQHPNCRMVTVAMDEVVFRHPVREGAILRICSHFVRSGRTSATYLVQVHSNQSGADILFSTQVTLVNINEEGHKQPISPNKSPGK